MVIAGEPIVVEGVAIGVGPEVRSHISTISVRVALHMGR